MLNLLFHDTFSAIMKSFPTGLMTKLRKLRFVGFDFDGVFTDGKLILHEDGTESVACSRRDGLGISELRRIGLKLVVISKERNKVVAARCKKLKIECAHGVDDKLALLKKLLKREHLRPREAAFMGDDFNDIPCMRHVGIAFAVADAYPLCKKVADYVTSRDGGQHAVREVCDLIVLAKEGPRA